MSIIAIDGIMGAGKTTFCTDMCRVLKSKNYDCEIMYENIDDHMLELYLTDRQRYAFIFQIYMLKRKIVIYDRALKLKLEGKYVIIDRSLLGDAIFEMFYYDQNIIAKLEHGYYLQLYNDAISKCVIPDITIYLNVTVDESYDRIHNRSRLNEKKIYSLEVIKKIKEFHETFIEDNVYILTIQNIHDDKIYNNSDKDYINPLVQMAIDKIPNLRVS
jgi:NADH dehydrogenase (ubiquinone) 1 alpha subcomplex subunit 10